MAYISGNLRVVAADRFGGPGKLWAYTTPADSADTITGAGYFADGAAKGMRVGDLVDVVATTGPKSTRYQVTAQDGLAATVAAPIGIGINTTLVPPTSDPHVVGQIWNNSGVLAISAG